MRFQTIKRIINVIALFIALILGGCAGVGMLPTLSEQHSPQIKEGVVVARVINASAYPLPYNQLTIVPKNLHQSKKIKPSRLQALPISTTTSTIFSAAVKAGSYSLDSIRSFYTKGDYSYSNWVRADVHFGTFNVIPGQVTDLGTIIYYPKPEEDKYINTLIRLPAVDQGEVLQQYFPFYSFNSETVATWSEDEYEEQRFELYASIAQNPITFNERYSAPDNTLYFIGKLGVILSRTPEREWEVDAVETNLDLSAIVQSINGDLVVGGDEGTIYYKQNAGDWKNISIDNSHYIEAFYFNSNNKLTAITRQQSKVHVMSLHNLEGEWQTITTYTYKKGWEHDRPDPDMIKNEKENKKTGFNYKVSKKLKKPNFKPNRIVSVKLSRLQGKHIIEISHESTRDTFYFDGVETYSYDPVFWKTTPYNRDFTIDKIINAGTAKIGVDYTGFWSWVDKPTFYKLDNTFNKWHKIRTDVLICNSSVRHLKGGVCVKKGSKKGVRAHIIPFTFSSIPWFSNNTHGIGIVTISGDDEENSGIKIVETFDAGKRWQITENKLPNKLCTQIIGEVKDSLLLSCEGFSSDFYESTDYGKTWSLVREQESF